MFGKALILSALASVAFAAECTRTYTVKAGDWCDTISQANNVSTYQLATVNPDINDSCTNLEEGQKLCLGTKDLDCTTTYTVMAGDSCEKIMSVARINDTMLYHNNPQIDAYCSNLYIGEVVCVRDAAVAPVEVEGRHPGSAGGVPAGEPAPVPYPAAQNRKPKSKNTTPSSSAAAAPSDAPPAPEAAAPAPAPAPVQDDEDDSNLPECEDPNDDGYYH